MHWSVVVIAEDAALDVVRLEPPDGSFDDPRSTPLREPDRAALVAYIEKNDVVPLAPLMATLPELTVASRETSPGGDNMAPRYTHTTSLHLGTPHVLDTLDNVAVRSPDVTAYAIPGGRFVVVNRTAAHADEGIYGTDVTAWRCDREHDDCRVAR
jgi:hypothetical protein